MGRRFKIASLRGIPIYVSSSWIWIAVLYTYIFYIRFTEGPVVAAPGSAIAFAVLATALFFGSVFVHEIAHAITARTLGLAVAGITLEFWGGRTETLAERRGPRAEFLVSAVGPASTLALAGVFWLASHGFAEGTSLSDLLRWLGGVNLLLGGLNAIPGFPLDGGRMFLATVWGITGDRRRALGAASATGIAIGAGFAALGLYQLAGRNQVANGNNTFGFGIWFLFLAWVLIGTSRGLRARLRVHRILARGRVVEAMGPAPGSVPSAMSLSEALDLFLRDHPHEAFPVVEDGMVVGAVSLDSARRAETNGPFRSVRDGMFPLPDAPVVSPDDRLDEAVDVLQGRRGLVVRDGELLGSISTAEIGRWYERRSGAGATAPGEPLIPPRPDV